MTEAVLKRERWTPVPAAASPSAVLRISLTEFRCYAAARLDVEARPVVLTGPNGAGKTNLLEAVSFLVPGRGLRRARLAEVLRRAPDGGEAPTNWAVAARVSTGLGLVEIGTGRDPTADAGSDRRVVRLDGAPARSQAALGEHLAAVWLTPQMDRLFVEGATGRRRFLDRLVYGLDPAHAGRVTAWDNAMRQRARLLQQGPRDPAWLNALEETMAGRAVAVAASRRELVRRLNTVADAGGAFPVPRLAAVGEVEGWLEDASAVEAEARARGRLAADRQRDGEAGGAALGPHRSDLAVFDRARDLAAAACSTGEQKALLIAIVLATARLIAAERGGPPLLLLDEVAAHLDEGRRRALFDAVLALRAQAWLTGTDEATFAPLAGHAQFVRIEDAVLTPVRHASP